MSEVAFSDVAVQMRKATHSEDSDQIVRMRSLIRIFAVRTFQKVYFLTSWTFSVEVISSSRYLVALLKPLSC